MKFIKHGNVGAYKHGELKHEITRHITYERIVNLRHINSKHKL